MIDRSDDCEEAIELLPLLRTHLLRGDMVRLVCPPVALRAANRRE